MNSTESLSRPAPVRRILGESRPLAAASEGEARAGAACAWSLKAYLRERGYNVAHPGTGEDRKLFERLQTDASENPGAEGRFLKDVAAYYGLEYRESVEGVTVDERRLSQIGYAAAKAGGFVPITGGQVLANTPYVDGQEGSRLALSTSANIYLLLRGSSIKPSQDETDPSEVLMEILQSAVLGNVSDIHIEPRRGGTMVRFRLDGLLKEEMRLQGGRDFHERLTNKIYSLSSVEASGFAALHDTSFTIEIMKRSVFVRVSSVPVPQHASGFEESEAACQAALVLRLLYNRLSGVTPLDALGYTPDSVATIKKLIALPYGIILMAGPTGSGKTTTLYSMMDLKRQEPVKILAVEDPVEFPLDGVIQVEVNPDRNITFANAVRSFLRHDPDVILIGEVRDKETATEALRASLTGHLVFATIHANTAAETVPRLLNLGLDMDQLLSSIKGCIAQRLVRKLCPECRRHVSDPAAHLGMDEASYRRHYNGTFDATGIYAPVGCPACDHTGYRGRTVLWEILLLNAEVKKYVLESRGFIDAGEAMGKCGQDSMSETGIKMVQQGVTSVEEIERFIPVSQVVKDLM